jgi:hypothetical protein
MTFIYEANAVLPSITTYAFEISFLLTCNFTAESLLCHSTHLSFVPSNIDSHTIATRQSQNYLLQANLTVYQKGVYYVGIKMLGCPLRFRAVTVILRGLRLY